MRWNSEVQEFRGAQDASGRPRLTGLLLRSNITSSEVSNLECDAAFVAIGHDPNTAMFRGALDMDEETGYLLQRLDPRRPLCTASSPPATWQTRSIARP